MQAFFMAPCRSGKRFASAGFSAKLRNSPTFPRFAMRLPHLFAGLTLALAVVSAHAIERWFPANAKRGVASFVSYPTITIDGIDYKPAPGLRIWNTMNVLQFQNGTKGDRVIINYTIDAFKLIDRVWILTPEEAAKPPPASTRPIFTGTSSSSTSSTTVSTTTSANQ